MSFNGVKVNLDYVEEGVEYYNATFTFGDFSFTIEEPYYNHKEEWESFLDLDVETQELRTSHEGKIVLKDDEVHFSASPSGPGDDISFTYIYRDVDQFRLMVNIILDEGNEKDLWC